MIVTVASYKGGVGKTTTAIHLAAFLQQSAPTLLIDGDIIRAATKWSQRSENGFPFKIVDEAQSVMAAREYIAGGHIVIDTEANPARVDFAEVAKGCDLLVIPAIPETTATDGLTYTLKALRDIGTDRYRVLLTKVRPKPNSDAEELRRNLAEAAVPVFSAAIPNLIAFDKASAHGVAVYDAPDPYAERAWEAYQSAGKEIINGQ